MSAVLGTMIGSAFTPNTFDGAGKWAFSMAALVLFTIATTILIAAILRRWGGFGPITAFFSSAPGNVTNIIIIGRAMGGDDRTIALVHSTRLLMLVVLTPIWLHIYYGIESSAASGVVNGLVSDLSLLDAAILIACCIVGVWLGRLLRLPGPEFFGPMVLSAAIHMLGGTAARPPGEVIAVAQILLGTSIGCRFVGYGIVRIFKTLALASVTTCILVILAVLASLSVTALVDLETIDLILSFVPGSLVVMTVLSLTLGADTALVTAHHLCRMITIVLLTPLLCRLVVGKSPPREGVD